MKRTFLLVLAAAMIAALMLAAGCGGSDDTTTTGATETTVSSDATPDTTGTPPTAGSADGAAIFATNCAVCHGAQGQGGNGPDIRPLGDGDRDHIIEQVTNGGSAMPQFNGGNPMPPFGNRLSAAEINAVAAYTVTLQ